MHPGNEASNDIRREEQARRAGARALEISGELAGRGQTGAGQEEAIVRMARSCDQCQTRWQGQGKGQGQAPLIMRKYMKKEYAELRTFLAELDLAKN
jgi:hypothetical protein